MSFFSKAMMVVAAVAALMAALPAGAQAAAPGFSAQVRPAVTQVGQAVSGIDISRWKAPKEVKAATQQNVGSIQRDLSGTLPGLLEQSDAAPESVPAAFAVYRNIGALYDTLLRVVETAGLAAPDQDMSALGSALNQLEGARRSLGDAILSHSAAQEAELVRLRTAIATAAAAPTRPTKTTVVDDGPAPEVRSHKRTTKKHTPAAASTKPTEKTPPPQ